jgi:hypothetical protein
MGRRAPVGVVVLATYRIGMGGAQVEIGGVPPF